MFDGVGKLKQNKETYFGEFKRGMRHGRGILSDHKGAKKVLYENEMLVGNIEFDTNFILN